MTDATGTDAPADGDYQAAMRAAIREIRREGYKVAVIYGLIDAALVAVGANLLTKLITIDVFTQPVVLANQFGPIPPLTTGTLVALGLGLLVLLAEIAWRIRQPIVERFEAVNPEVHEALRTARDAVQHDDESLMATALYEDVITRLQATSSIGLVSVPRLAVTIAVVIAISLASIQVAVVPVDVSPGTLVGNTNGASGPASGAVNGSDVSQTPAAGDLGASEDILGTPTDIDTGSENLSATLPSSVGTGDEQARSYDSGGYESGSSSVDAQRAGYATDEDVENADLIKEYNLRIREEDRE